MSIEPVEKANVGQLAPQNQFPIPALNESKQIVPDITSLPFAGFTIALASAADALPKWGTNVKQRDQKLREFIVSESFLAGTHYNVCTRNSVFDWEIKHSSQSVITAVTDMLRTAISGDVIGWQPFVQKFSSDLYGQDNGAFIELIRDPGVDANSKFKGPMAPVIGIANIDSYECTRTGNPEYPVIYVDADGNDHKLAWYEVIPYSDFPSPIRRMNGVGICSVSRAARLAQIMRSIAIYKDENVSGRNVQRVHIVGGVTNTQIADAVKRTQETADNKGFARFIEHVVLASLDPDKPVSVETIDLASLPEGFNFDQEMQWYIAGLALDYGVDYQDLAPLPGGGIGSATQSIMLHKKSYGKGPRAWMDGIAESFSVYGVIPRGAEMVFTDVNEQEELEKQEIRTKAAEEAAIVVNSKIFPPEVVAQSLVRRGIYDKEDFENTPPEWWKLAMQAAENEAKKQPVGDRGGNTIREDTSRQENGKTEQKSGGRLRKQ